MNTEPLEKQQIASGTLNTNRRDISSAETVRASVLVVDDEPSVATVLARGLSYAGYETRTAHSGQEALDLLAERPFDAVLSDIHMPRMRGDRMQRIARERDPDLAVLLITAANDTTSAIECLKEGVYDYLLKPFDLADVVVRVGNALERRRLVRENREYQRDLERRLNEQAQRLQRTSQGSLEALIFALEAKDPNTRNHSTRVARLATYLAAILVGQDDFTARVRIAALFHDIGKIGIPEALLNKQGLLTEAEMAEVRRHPEIGETILRPLLEPEAVAMVRSHHEHLNGEGYPDRLVGDAIPLGGRIIAVADAFDAMTSPRPYRPMLPLPLVLARLREGAGRQWDAAVVAALLDVHAKGSLPLTAWDEFAPESAVTGTFRTLDRDCEMATVK